MAIIPKSSNLPTTEYTGLTFDNIVIDIKNKIKENPQYNRNWEDFLSANAGRMLIEMFAYIVEQLGIRVDLLVNEMFLSSAQQPESIIKILNQLNYTPTLSNAAEVVLKSTSDLRYTKNIRMPYPLVISTTDLNGSSIQFELIKKNTDGKFEYPYDSESTGHIYEFSVSNFNPRIDNITFYQGTTVNESYIASGIENEFISLGSSDLIKNSLRIWKKFLDTQGNVYYKEATLVSNFLTPEAQSNDTFLPFILKLLSTGELAVVFSNKEIMVNREESTITNADDNTFFEDKLPIEGDEYTIFYRTGGSENGNINAGAINTSKSFFDDNNNTNVTISFTNPKPAKYGSDSETLDEARVNAPMVIATNNRKATIEDNKAIIGSLSYVIKSVHYSQQNMPNNLFDKYGYNILPLETWHFIVPNIVGWNSKKSYEYKDILRFTSKDTEIINEEKKFGLGKINIRVTTPSTVEKTITENSTSYDLIRKTYVLNETLTRDFIEYSTGVALLLNIGENDCSLVNYEGNESNFEKINIKITDSPISEDIIKWLSVTTDYAFDSNGFIEDTWTSTQNGKFFIELTDNTQVKITIQDLKANLDGVNISNIHYLKPDCFYNNEEGNRYKYVLLDNGTIYPNTFENPYEIKITDETTTDRTVIKITSDYEENTDYRIERSLSNKYYRLTDEGIQDSTISDFETFYLHYRVDNRGTDLEVYTDNVIGDDTSLFVQSSTLGIKVSVTIDDETQSDLIQDIQFYDIIKDLQATAITISSITAGVNDYLDESLVDKYILISKIDGSIVTTEITAVNPLTKVITFNTISSLTGISATPPFKIVSKPTGVSIQDTLNDKFRASSVEFIRGDVFAYFDTELDKICFLLRNVPSEKNYVSSMVISDIPGSTDDEKLSLILGYSNPDSTSDTNSDGINDVYYETTEYLINREIFGTDLTCTTNIYKQPIFRSFDLWINVYYNKNYNASSIQESIENKIRDRYSLANMDFNEDVSKSEISSIIHSVIGVYSASIDYFGENYNQKETYTNKDNYIDVDFDEIMVVSDNIYLEGFPETREYQTNGININMIRVI